MEIKLERNPYFEEDYYRYHPRVWQRNGWIIDLGCLGWDWSKPFIGKKKLLGVDAIETKYPEGVYFVRGFVGTVSGEVKFNLKEEDEAISSHIKGTERRPIYTLEELIHPQGLYFENFIKNYDIDEIDILKMNIEGSEYEILINLRKPIADQIIVAFHTHTGYNPRAIEAIKFYLEQWYDWILLDAEYNWHLFLRR